MNFQTIMPKEPHTEEHMNTLYGLCVVLEQVNLICGLKTTTTTKKTSVIIASGRMGQGLMGKMDEGIFSGAGNVSYTEMSTSFIYIFIHTHTYIHTFVKMQLVYT